MGCQSPLRFNQHLNYTLIKLGWEFYTFNPCLYLHAESGAHLVVVVNDVILTSPSVTFTKEFHVNMSAVHDIKDLGEPKCVIDVWVQIDKDSLKLLQDRHTTDLRENLKDNIHAVSTSTACMINLSP